MARKLTSHLYKNLLEKFSINIFFEIFVRTKIIILLISSYSQVLKKISRANNSSLTIQTLVSILFIHGNAHFYLARARKL